MKLIVMWQITFDKKLFIILGQYKEAVLVAVWFGVVSELYVYMHI